MAEVTEAALKADSRLERILARRHFAVTVEVTPPASASPDGLRSLARSLRGHGDAFNVTEGHRALVRMASWSAAVILLQDGLEPIMQVVTRDRNRIALQADVLGAAALGVRNLLCLRGDDPSSGNEPGAKPVYELTTEEMLAMLRGMRDDGRLLGGDEIEVRPRFFLGAAANPFAGSAEDAFANLRGKVEAGADFIQTQAVYDVDAFEAWMQLVRKEWLHDRVAILAGVIPLKSAKMARFMAEKVPGIDVPAPIITRLERAADPKAEGLRIALEMIQSLRKVPGVRGVHLMAANWNEAVSDLVVRAGLFPRPDA